MYNTKYFGFFPHVEMPEDTPKPKPVTQISIDVTLECDVETDNHVGAVEALRNELIRAGIDVKKIHIARTKTVGGKETIEVFSK